MSTYREITKLSPREQMRTRPSMTIGDVNSSDYGSHDAPGQRDRR